MSDADIYERSEQIQPNKSHPERTPSEEMDIVIYLWTEFTSKSSKKLSHLKEWLP